MEKKEKRNQKSSHSPEIILSPNGEKMVSLAEYNRVWKYLLILAIIGIIITAAGLWVYHCNEIYNITVSANEKVDDYFSMKYETVYYPETKDDIEEIISTASAISDPYQRLDTIGAWVCEDFIDYVEMDTPLTPYPTDDIGTYVYDSEGRVRAVSGEYHGDPYWIAYHRFGGCGELGYLFAHIARESGLETRIMKAEYTEKRNNHVWLEIKIDDEWIYVDPTLYWCSEYYQKPFDWILPREEWGIWDERLLGIWDIESEEEMSSHYPLSNQSTIFEKSIRIPLRKYFGI